jgi:alkylhydroperoxidase/carboxymuconolactone decarboxylase family protein YurZ
MGSSRQGDTGERTRSRRLAGGAGLAALMRFAVAGARGDEAAVARAARAARRAGTVRRAIEETALMLVLYAGYPAALETFRVLNRVWPGHARRSHEGSPAAWRRRGMALSRRVYGPVHARLVAAVRTLHPDLAAWMVEEGYGRVLARPGLAVEVREQITVAVLSALGRERQLVSHLLGAARAGVPAPAIRRALAVGTGMRVAAAVSTASARHAWRSAFGAGWGARRGAGRAR